VRGILLETEAKTVSGRSSEVLFDY